MPTKTDKTAAIESFRQHKSDTGSTSVQIGHLTERINHLAKHLETNKKDFSTRVGLLKLVGQRRRLLNYLGKEDQAQYKKVLVELNLRK